MYLITRWFGTFICDRNGVRKKIIFPNNAQEIKKRLMKIDNNCILEEEKKILTKIKQVKVNEKRLLLFDRSQVPKASLEAGNPIQASLISDFLSSPICTNLYGFVPHMDTIWTPNLPFATLPKNLPKSSFCKG